MPLKADTRFWRPSSQIECFGYDAVRSELVVRFKSAPVDYYYTGVPIEVFEGMLVAQSVGTFHNTYLKGKYPCLKGEQRVAV